MASFCRCGGFTAEFGAKRRHASHQSLIRGGKVIAVEPDIVLQAGAAVAPQFKAPSVHFILVPPNAGSRPGTSRIAGMAFLTLNTNCT